MRQVLSVIAKIGGLLAIAAVMAIATPAKANAAMFALICDDAACTGGGDTIVEDNMGGDTSAVVNFINMNGTIAGIDVTADLVSSGSPASNPLLTMAWTARCLTPTCPGGSVWMYAADTDFIPITQLSINYNSAVGSTANGGVWGGATNVLPTGTLDLSSVLTSWGAVDNYAAMFGPATANPYFLIAGFQINIAGGTGPGSTVTGDLGINAVPEPASMLLLGTGLAGVVARMRRKSQKA